MKRLFALLILLGAVCLGTSAWAQEAAVTEPVVSEAAVAVAVETAPAAEPSEVTPPDTGNTAWMLTSTMLVILMTIPGLALFYGGLARSKNMLSVLMHVFVIFCLTTFLWCVYGYSLAFSGTGDVVGDLGKIFLWSITIDHLNGTMPEYVWVAFQSTFAAITTALIVGAFAERIKFSAVVIFAVLWFTFSYVPMAHIVWGGGFLAAEYAMDFAGGTVVHINAGIAGLVGAYLLGKRLGFGREAFTPHSLTLTMVGASLLWVGWFGFNAGSAGAANGTAGLAFVNTILATAAAVLSWIATEAVVKGKPSMLGAASGAVAGLVAVTPAAGFIGPVGAIVLGLLAGIICLWGVSGLKKLLGADDAFDVFGVHGVGGILGAILTGVLASPDLGGLGNTLLDDPKSMTIAGQLVTQVKSVGVTILWSGIVAFIAYKIADFTVGLRVSEEQEREGLDITSHGEKAYHY
ncbi:MAG: ammonium transporter [Zoogloeaceae bacterium]|jgi:Amt family ammonium transporter|nr:ammonium transporter [Zoogloeaceae bacterium]